MPNSTLRVSVLYDPVSNLDSNRLSTIQAGTINLDRFSREKPADRQRFKRSLSKPFLFAINSDAELSGEIVEGRERNDQIRTREQPTSDPRREQSM